MLQLFGRPTLTNHSGERVNLSPGSWRLLAVLAMAPQEGIARTKLGKLVLTTGKLSTLRKLVWDTRSVLDTVGMRLIEGDGSTLRLASDIACDVHELRDVNVRRPLYDIYRGVFFDFAPNFNHEPWISWLTEQRSEIYDLYLAKATKLLISTNADRITKEREARHLLKHAPNHVEATQALMLEGARASNAAEVQRWYTDLRLRLEAEGSRPNQRTTDLFHRLVGASQRELGAGLSSEKINFPTIYIPVPAIDTMARGARLLRSLLADIRIGLSRASLFRVIDGHPNDMIDIDFKSEGSQRHNRSYLVTTSTIDHVLGEQILFILMSLPGREILWTERIDARADFTVIAYNILTAGVLQSLVQRIQDLEIEAFRLDTDPGAYGLFLAGSSTLGSLDLAALRKGRQQLKRSLSQSTDFAPTSSALARSYAQEWLVTGHGEKALLFKARELSVHAIGSDPYEARGFSALGFCDLYEKRYADALENYGRAEQLNRNFADLIAEHANCLLHCGAANEALQKINYAIAMNPNGSDLYHWSKASILYFLSRYNDVLSAIDSVRDREPVMRLMAATHALLGNKEEAKKCRMRALETYPSMTIAGWTNTIAMKDPGHIQHYIEGLTLAGFH